MEWSAVARALAARKPHLESPDMPRAHDILEDKTLQAAAKVNCKIDLSPRLCRKLAL